jgi:hypothetical protein
MRKPWLTWGCCFLEIETVGYIEIVGYIEAKGIKMCEIYVAKDQNI